MTAPMLQIEALTRRFGGLVAVNEVSFSVGQGERCVILGPNGAGKTTLFHCITGMMRASSGRILMNGETITRLSANERVGKGIGRTFQITNLFKELTLLENVILAAYGRAGGSWSFWGGWRQDAQHLIVAQEALERVGLAALADRSVAELAYGQSRQLELALALAGGPKLVLLDEPCAGLAPGDRQRVADLVAGLPQEMTVVLVEHDMDVAFAIADRVVVMNRGELICDGSPDAVRNDERVREVYLGDA